MAHAKTRAKPRPKKRRAVRATPVTRAKAVRTEIIRLHRQVFRRNQQRINESVSGYTGAFRNYEKSYGRFVRRYKRVADFDELDRMVAESDLMYVGDYHTLRQAQRAFLRLMRRIPNDRPVTIALEFVQARHQASIDAFLGGNIDEETFLERIQHRSHWVFGGWSSFREVFELARARGFRIIGIDTMGRGPAGTSLTARDQAAARILARAHKQRPDDLIMVLIGELHVAPAHLPSVVNGLLRRPARNLIVYQNCEKLYWQLETRGQEHEVELVEVAARQYCIMNTPPIICQQSFLNWLDLEGEEDSDATSQPSPEERFRDFARLIARFFDLDIGEAAEEVEVHSVVDLSFLDRLRTRGDFTPTEIQTIKKQILASESYFIPRAKMVYLGNLSINHAAEEAAHFVRHACAEAVEPRLLVDAFYARVLEEAMGFLGSKLINHKRKCARPDHFRKLLYKKNIPPGERRLAQLMLRHEAMEHGRGRVGLADIYECDADTFNALTHVIGYQLGERTYYAMVEGIIDKQRIRDIFFETFEDEGEALTTYLFLAASTRDVTLPERL